MRVISDETDAYGNATVVVALEPQDLEALEEATDADVEARFHVDGYPDPGGTHDTWEEAAAEVVEKSDYDILVETVSIRTIEEGQDETHRDPRSVVSYRVQGANVSPLFCPSCAEAAPRDDLVPRTVEEMENSGRDTASCVICDGTIYEREDGGDSER